MLFLLEGRGLAGGGEDVLLREAESLTKIGGLADFAETVGNAEGADGNTLERESLAHGGMQAADDVVVLNCQHGSGLVRWNRNGL